MIAAPSPSPAPAWVNDHRHAGHKGTYFARFPEKRASLRGCSLRAGSALPPGSWEQPSLPAANGLRLAGLPQPGRQRYPAPAGLQPVPAPCRSRATPGAAPPVAAAREKAARMMYGAVVSSRTLRPHHLQQLLALRKIGLGLGLAVLPPSVGVSLPWSCLANTHVALPSACRCWPSTPCPCSMVDWPFLIPCAPESLWQGTAACRASVRT